MKKLLSIIWLSTSIFFFNPAVSQAVIFYDFEVFTAEGSYHDDSGLNMHVEVWEEADDNRVRFEFHNTSTIASSTIGRIYFDGDSFAGIWDIESGSDVQFHQGATPGHLPAGNLLEPVFETNRSYSLAADNSIPHNGVNSGEGVGVTFDMQSGLTYDNIISGLNDASLRIGLHVTGLPDGSGESAINSTAGTSTMSVPEPATIAMLGLGSLILFCRHRRLGKTTKVQTNAISSMAARCVSLSLHKVSGWGRQTQFFQL